MIKVRVKRKKRTWLLTETVVVREELWWYYYSSSIELLKTTGSCIAQLSENQQLKMMNE